MLSPTASVSMKRASSSNDVSDLTFSAMDTSTLNRGRASASHNDLERMALRRGDREEEALLQVCGLCARRAHSPGYRQTSHPGVLVLTQPSSCAHLLRAQAVLAASAKQTPRIDEQSGWEKGDKEDDPFNPLDVGATPSFDEIFG